MNEARKILVSPGHGAGWSTWNNHSKFLATDPILVEMAERKADATEVKEYLKTALGEDSEIYMCGWRQIEVRDAFGQFFIEEYDGYEYIKTYDDIEWI